MQRVHIYGLHTRTPENRARANTGTHIFFTLTYSTTYKLQLLKNFVQHTTMKLITLIVSLLQLFTVSLAYTVSEGKIKVGSQVVEYGEFNTQEIKQLSIDLKDKIELEFQLNGEVDEKPHQLVVTLGNGKGLETSFVPSFVPNNQAIKLTIPVIKLPASLKTQEKLFLHLIVANANPKEPNVYKFLGEVLPADNLRVNTKYEKAPRIGIKPEIHHIFRNDESTVNAIIPLVFIGAAVALFFALLASWAGFIGSDLFGTVKNVHGAGIIYHFGFFGSLVAFETIFINYYLLTSIFKTLAHGLIVGLASIYFGSKVLRSFSAQRRVGRA